MKSRNKCSLISDRRISCPAAIDHLSEAVSFVLSCAGRSGLSDKQIKDIHLAVEEAVVNIINYAYGDAKGDFQIACSSSDDGRFVIEISDAGIPFNIFSLPEPDMDADIAERTIGGLGVHLIKTLMDEVDYRYEDNKNILTLTVLPAKVSEPES